MAKASMRERNKKRGKMVESLRKKREALLKIARDRNADPAARFQAGQKLAKLPRNSAPTRHNNICQLDGRPHAVYRKMKINRVKFRELASHGELPGVTKSSW